MSTSAMLTTLQAIPSEAAAIDSTAREGRFTEPRQNEPDLPLFEFSHRVIGSADELGECEAAWKRLAETAVEPNAFYEPWFLLPAWRHLADGKLEVLLIEAPKRVYPEGPKVLCGLFPLIRRRTFYGLPTRCWELWRHQHCFLGTPLVRADCAREVLDCFFKIAAGSPRGASVVHFPLLAGDGPLHRIMVESNYAAGRTVFTKDLQTRALFESERSAEAFLKIRLSRNKRQGMQRMERRLSEAGALTTSWFAAGDDIDAWADDFLELESSGWKGANGSALKSDAAQANFFREMVRSAAGNQKLLFGRLDFEGRTIAMICNFLTRDGGYSFKIAYDEAADRSPGVLMELALVRELHQRNVRWMDSCATADHSLINPLWPGRAIRQSLVVSTGSRKSALAVALMPLIRWFKDCLRKHGTAADQT